MLTNWQEQAHRQKKRLGVDWRAVAGSRSRLASRQQRHQNHANQQRAEPHEATPPERTRRINEAGAHRQLASRRLQRDGTPHPQPALTAWR